MKRYILLLIAFSLNLQIVFSQSAELSNLRDINIYLTERNECIDYLNLERDKLTLCDSLIEEYQTLIALQENEQSTTDTLLIEEKELRIKTEQCLIKEKKTNKTLSKLLTASIVVSLILLLI